MDEAVTADGPFLCDIALRQFLLEFLQLCLQLGIGLSHSGGVMR
jgi:hypothetical protein